ncbi:MAG: hypothetical protein N4A35_04555 [Flavobacteriales bacterium]|nr:hypothetical protein [Flavobacteriales bacterium]
MLYFVYTKFYTVRGEADIFKYFDDSAVVFNALWEKPIDYVRLVFTSSPDNQYYYDHYYVKMNHWANLHDSIFYGDSVFMIKINAFLRLFSWGSFQIQSLFFNYFGFVGLIGIYRAFKSFLQIQSPYLIFVTVGLPSVLFWSSSVLKESLLLLFLGGICFQLLHIKTLERVSFKNFLIIGGLLYLLALLKFYIVFALAIPILAYTINQRIKIKYSIVTYFAITLVFLTIFFNSPLLSTLILKQHDFLTLVANTNAGSYFEIPYLEANFMSVLKAIPYGILNSFIRPLPQAGMSIMAFPAIFENILLLSGLIYVCPAMLQLKNWGMKTNALLFIVFFTFLLFAVIGITTPVAGALVRYKVAALPFLAIFIFYFLEQKKSIHQL